MEPRVFVQHCILARFARLETGEHTLGGISYTYSVPADSEFGEFGNLVPGKYSLFLRLRGRDAGPVHVLARHHYRDGGQWREMARFPREKAVPLPEAGERVEDVIMNFPYLAAGGIGLHAITVHFRSAEPPGESETEVRDLPAWRDDDEWADEPGWDHGATEYFEIVRGT